MKQFFTLLLAAISFLIVPASYAQVTVSSSDTVNCLIPCTTLTAHVIGDVPTDAGITVDDVFETTPDPIGFTFNFYGINYTQCLIGPNGNICFDLTQAGLTTDWAITAPLLGNSIVFNSICGPWCDIDVIYGGTITYSTDGVAPNRKFVVTFCGDHMYSCTDQITTSQVILYETTNVIEVHVAHKDICTDWNPSSPAGAGGRAIIGVQNATGTAATAAPGRDWTPVWSASDEAWRFTPVGGGTSYTVASIPYAPIPYASSLVYWYNYATGAYIGTGDTLRVCPTSPTTYRAGALGCADTSFGYYTINIAALPPITLTATNPTLCGGTDGTITIHNLTRSSPVIINYDFGGVAQPAITTTSSSSGTVTITGLSSGVYSNFIATVGGCNTPTAGPITLTDPPISISSVTSSNPTACGVCDGTLTLHGLYPSHSFTVSYNFRGVAQTPVVTSSTAAGTITLTGLCEGDYENIIASFGTCITPPVGTYTLTAPAPPTYNLIGFTNPSQCGYCDGTITIKGIKPFTFDTVNYSMNGVVQPYIVSVARADSTILLVNLCDKSTYSSFTVTVGPCLSTVIGSATMQAPPITDSFYNVVHLGCNGDSVFFYNLSTNSGPLYYVWNFGDGTTDRTENPMHIFAQGVYTVTLSAGNHVCTDTFTVKDSLVHPLKAIFTETPDIICQKEPVTFTNSSIGTAATYAWNFGDGRNGSTTANPAYTYNNTGVYKVQLVATDFVPCSDTAYSTVYVDSTSPISLSVTDSVLCRSTYTTFYANYTAIGNTGITWNFGNGDSILNVNPVQHAFDGTGNFMVTATAHFRACRDTSVSKLVTVYQMPSLDLADEYSICPGSESLVLADNLNINTAHTSWQWSTGATTPGITVVEPGVYTLTVNISGCINGETITVKNDCYMNIPNVFTPNNDGLNDYFFPRQYLTSGLTTFSMSIYNRWGQLVFESTSLDGRGWDGKFNGVDQIEGVYVYIIDATFKDGQKEHHQGNVTLLR